MTLKRSGGPRFDGICIFFSLWARIVPYSQVAFFNNVISSYHKYDNLNSKDSSNSTTNREICICKEILK